MLAAVVVAGLIAYVAFYGRVGSMYLAVVTLTVTLILYQLMVSTADPKYAIGEARLGGYNGMTIYLRCLSSVAAAQRSVRWNSSTSLGDCSTSP